MRAADIVGRLAATGPRYLWGRSASSIGRTDTTSTTGSRPTSAHTKLERFTSHPSSASPHTRPARRSPTLSGDPARRRRCPNLLTRYAPSGSR
jgi:hypothetical protein